MTSATVRRKSDSNSYTPTEDASLRCSVAACDEPPFVVGRGHGISIPKLAPINHHCRDDLGSAPVSGMIWMVRRARRDGVGMYDCNKQSHAWRDRVYKDHLSDLTTLAQEIKSQKEPQHCV